MRHIDFFYLEKITYPTFKKEQEKWEEAGFEFVPYHFLVNLIGFDSFKQTTDIEDIVTRGRPFKMNNGLIRDSFISKRGIGILLIVENEHINDDMYDVLGRLIKNTSMDLGIENHQLVTNFYENEKKVDTIKVNYAIKEAKDKFIRIRN